jgi:glucan 1,4-alpha-glucosidase
MKIRIIIHFLVLISFSLVAQSIQSPDKNLKLRFSLTPSGEATYEIFYWNKEVIKTSKLGLELRDKTALTQDFVITRVDSTTVDESWSPVWGEVKTIRNHYKELTITLTQSSVENRQMILRFRLFNDGVGFRYEFPKQTALDHFIITHEITEFNLAGDHKVFWIPGDYNTNEYAYNTTRFSEITTERIASADEIHARHLLKNAVQTPLMMKSSDGIYINIHEAALVNYPVMQLDVNPAAFTLSCHLAQDAYANKAYLQTPFHTPWRTVLVNNNPAVLLNSKTILNLNEPSKLADVSWIRPIKYVGIWWEMHVGKSTWFYSDETNLKLNETDWKSLKPNGKHGATTANTKRYIDFAATHGLDAVLIEGWNVGWEDWFGQWKEDVFDFVTPYPDFDVKELQHYAASKGVELIMHHETSASITNYERRMDEAYRFMKDHGYNAVKTGYVGRIIPRGEYHDSQWSVNHFNRAVEKTAAYKIMINSHESIRPTGLHRTYPNWIASEAARGNEFNAWSSGNPPDHETILPFTRLMGGPMDYTPGIFEIKMSHYNPDNTAQVHTTLAKQLALYVTMYSPLQMAADLPENYEKRMDAFQFIKDVAVDWDDTRVLQAEPGDYITIARKAKNKDEWYIGAITDEQGRKTTAPLAFLPANEWYVATLYTDAPDAHWKNNPMAYRIQKALVNSKTKLEVDLAPGGGAAVSLRKAAADDLKKIKRYKP